MDLFLVLFLVLVMKSGLYPIGIIVLFIFGLLYHLLLSLFCYFFILFISSILFAFSFISSILFSLFFYSLFYYFISLLSLVFSHCYILYTEEYFQLIADIVNTVILLISA